MSEYWIERREVGWPRYRVHREGPTFVALMTGSGQIEVSAVVAKRFTRRGAERYIAKVTWNKIREAS